MFRAERVAPEMTNLEQIMGHPEEKHAPKSENHGILAKVGKPAPYFDLEVYNYFRIFFFFDFIRQLCQCQISRMLI